jgi:hypothetical protein
MNNLICLNRLTGLALKAFMEYIQTVTNMIVSTSRPGTFIKEFNNFYGVNPARSCSR